jgi:integrase
MVERQLPKLHTGVRFPSPAPNERKSLISLKKQRCPLAATGAHYIGGLAVAQVSCVYRRPSGVYAVRLVVPLRHRAVIGKGEVHQSTGTRTLALAKVVSAGLLAHWRQKFLSLDRMDIPKLVVGSPALTAGGLLPVEEAAEASGFDVADLLRDASEGRLRAFYRLAHVWGHFAPTEALDDDLEAFGPPGSSQGPQNSEYTCTSGPLPLWESRGVASNLLAGSECSTRVFGAKNDAFVFVSQDCVPVTISRFEVDGHEVEALRLARKQMVTPLQVKVAMAGRIANKDISRPSEPVSVYVSKYLAGRSVGVKPDQLRQIGDLLRLFCEMTGDVKFSGINNQVVDTFRDIQLPEVPHNEEKQRAKLKSTSVLESIERLRGKEYKRLTPGSIQKRMAWLRSFLTWVEDQKSLNIKQIDKVGAAVKEKNNRARENRDMFSFADLTLIFSAVPFVNGSGEITKSGTYRTFMPWHYWGPLIGLYSGMRPNECCQMNVSDIREKDGFWVFDVNDDPGEDGSKQKSVKTNNGKRVIPIHPELVRLGLLDWRLKVEGAGHSRMFPEWKRHEVTGRYSAMASRWFNDTHLKQTLGIDRSRKKVLYSFRHNFVTGLGRIGMPEEKAVWITGHTKGSTVLKSVYDKGPKVSELAGYIEKLDFELPTIAPFDIAAGGKALADAMARKKSSASIRIGRVGGKSG